MGILPREGPLEQNLKNSQANKERLLEEFMLQNIQGKGWKKLTFIKY